MLLRIQQQSTGKFFVLKKGSTVSVETHTTFFNPQGDFYGSFSYPGEMPLNEYNQALVQNAQYIATDIRLRTFYVMLWLGDIPWKLCKLNFTITNGAIQYNVYYDATIVCSQLSGLQLNQLLGSFQGVPPVASSQVEPEDLLAYMTSTITAAPGAMPMVFAPYKNDGMYNYPAGDIAGVQFIGMWQADSNTPLLHNDNGSGIRPVGSLTGYFYLCDPAHYGTVDFNNDPDNPDEQTFNADYPYAMFDGLTWWATANRYGYIIENSPSTDLVYDMGNGGGSNGNKYVNRWQLDSLGNGGFILDPTGGPYSQTQSPMFYLSFVVRRVFAWFGINTIIGSAMQDPDFLRLVIWSAVALDIDGVIADVSYYMPNTTVSTFFKAIREWGYLVDFDMTRNVGIVEPFKKLSQTGEVMDLRPYQQPNAYREIPVTPTYYELTQAVDGADSSFPSDYAPPTVQVGEADETITLSQVTTNSVATNMVSEQAPLDPLLANTDQDTILGWPQPIFTNWRLPYIKQSLYRNAPFTPIVAVAANDANNFKLRLLYYHGMVADDVGYLYPYVSSDNQSVSDGALNTYSMSFDPGATDFQPLVNYYTFMQQAKPFEMGFMLSKYLVAKMRANMRYLVWDNKLRAPIMCLLDQALCDLKDFADKVGAKLTLYPLTMPSNTVPVAVPASSAPPTPPPDNGTVYVRFAEINETSTSETEPTDATRQNADLFVSFWSDSAGTVPKTVTSLPVTIRTTQATIVDFGEEGGTTVSGTITYSCNGESETLLVQAPLNQVNTDGSGDSETWTYVLLGSPYYTIIT